MFSAPVRITPPAGDLISYDDARSYLRINGTALNTEVDLLRAAAVEDVEEATGLRLLDQEVQVTADSFEDLALFRIGPIKSIDRIVYRDSDDVEQELDPSAYELMGPVFEQFARPATSWPAGARRGSIVVSLSVGYGAAAADVPKKLLFAVYAVMRAKFEDQEADISCLIGGNRFWLP